MLVQAYFPAKLIRTVPLSPGKSYVFGWHPHGILILSRIFVYGGVWELLFPGVNIRVLGASPMFKMPGCREICLWCGLGKRASVSGPPREKSPHRRYRRLETIDVPVTRGIVLASLDLP